MQVAALLVPLLFLAVFLFAAARRVKVYDSFATGAAGALPLLKNLFPYIAAVLVLTELFEASGLSAALQRALSPAFAALGVPPEIAPLVLVKPFSGSGATALLADLCARFGADSYIARCACAVYAAGDTVFYLSAVWYAGAPRPLRPVAASCAANLIAAVLACLLCQVL